MTPRMTPRERAEAALVTINPSAVEAVFCVPEDCYLAVLDAVHRTILEANNAELERRRAAEQLLHQIGVYVREAWNAGAGSGWKASAPLSTIRAYLAAALGELERR